MLHRTPDQLREMPLVELAQAALDAAEDSTRMINADRVVHGFPTDAARADLRAYLDLRHELLTRLWATPRPDVD